MLEHLNLEFFEYDDNIQMGDTELQTTCRTYAKTTQPKLTICIFDRDNKKILEEVTSKDSSFKDWGNNVVSFAIPIPAHRSNISDVCIELYYSDSEITRSDKYGRRLFLSNEFNPTTQRHKTENLNCPDHNKLNRPSTIIEAQVYNENHRNVALPKSNFSEYVLERAENFDDFDVTEFKKNI